MVAVAAGSEDENLGGGWVGQWPFRLGTDPGEVPPGEHVGLAFDEQRQLALEHQIDLLLAFVAVDAEALARAQAEQVDPEAGDAELAAQRLEGVSVGVD